MINYICYWLCITSEKVTALLLYFKRSQRCLSKNASCLCALVGIKKGPPFNQKASVLELFAAATYGFTDRVNRRSTPETILQPGR